MQAPPRALVLAAALVLLSVLGCQRVSEPPRQAAPPPAWGYPQPGWRAQPTGLWLPPPHTDAGVLSRMLIAECRGPAYPDYDERESYWAMQAMKAVVHNRLFSDPARFGATGARYYADIICAPGQWAGFGRGPRGEWWIEPEILQRVDEVVRQANTGTPGPYHRFVQHALAITYGAVQDPFAQLRWVEGQAVYPGAYGWRRAGSSPPGGKFVAIPAHQGGILAGNQFYALAAP